MYHINGNDEAKICRAKSPENCRFYRGEEDSRHYEDQNEAIAASEKLLEEKHGVIPTTVRYSFAKQFKQQEEKFKKDFQDFPNRFFNYDIRSRFIPTSLDLNDTEAIVNYPRILQTRAIMERAYQAVSSPSDNKISDEKVEELAAKYDITNLRKDEDESTKYNLKADRVWIGERNGQIITITDPSAAKSRMSNFSSYSFRRKIGLMEPGKSYKSMDVRMLVGADRVHNKIDMDTLLIALEDKDDDSNVEQLRQLRKISTLLIVSKLEDAQLEGNAFKAQQKYIKENSGKVATAYEDKKNPDKLHQELMKNTVLNNHFKKVEIDNDVDPVEFKNFEKDYLEVMEKLPKIPKGKEPELRIRKLGKHKAIGMYFPHKNTVTIDVNTSGAFVHEMAHQYDIYIKENASLRTEFRDIVRDYTKLVKIPETEPKSRSEYLATPTEIFARGYENYASQELGIHNRLIDERKFNNYDHTPFQDPALREKMFNFIRSVNAEIEK